MTISKKSYIDLSGLTEFRDLLLKTTIDVDADTSVSNKTASVSAILEYVSSVESGIINGVNTSLNSKVQSVGYASKKFTYTTGTGTTDIVSISTLKTDIGAMTGATSSSAGAMGLVPAPSSGKQASFLRGDGTWVVPTDTNTTYTVASGDNNGQIKVTPSSGSAYNVSVKGLGSAAYTESSAYASASHNHNDFYYTKTELDTKLNGKSNTGHTHTMSNITDLGVFGKSGATASVGLVPKPSTTAGTTKFLREDGTWVVPTGNNTTYTFETGTTNGAFSVTPSGGSAKSVSIYGLGSAAYTESSAYAPASHNHDTSYYLKTEVDTKLGGKSNIGHNHTISNITDLSIATSSTLGLVKSSKTGTTSNRNYVVEVNSDGTMKVNVPWTNTTNVSAPTTGDGNAVTSITASGSTISVTKGATFLTSHQDISGKENTSNKVKSWSSTTTDDHYPSEKLVKTALDGKYAKPSDGIPKSDLASAVQTSLGKADTALQKHQDISSKENTSNKVTSWSATTTHTNYPSEKLVKDSLDGKYAKPSDGIPKSDLASAVQTSLGKADTALQAHQNISGKEDKSNKVTSWSTTTTDTNYPSEKLVKDSLDSVYSAINNFDYRGRANTWSAVNTFSNGTDVTSASSTASGAIIASQGGIWAAGGIRGNKVYNAVWNDLADCIPVDEECELTPGYCYCFDGEKYYKSSKYLDDGIIGIHSDTYGMHMGYKDNCKQMDVAVAGFVLAYVDKEYPAGTPLTCTENGYLTKIEKSDKIEYPEKIVATYWKNEPSEYWGGEKDKIKVNGRKWVKIK